MNNLYSRGPADGMSPVTFGPCFGWFHAASSGRNGGTCALLCPGAGQDFSNGYRPFRLLADHLANAGYPALRFDYPSIGDSADSSATNLWAAWQESVGTAAEWLLAQTGMQHLLLIGLRIGGTLAAIAAAQRSDVAGLVLIEPCLTGRAYASQLLTEARLRGMKPDDKSVEVGELAFTPECLAQMRAVELARLSLSPKLPVTIFSRTPSEKIMARLESWCESNVNLTCRDLGGLEAILRPSHHSGEAEMEVSQLIDWLKFEIPSQVILPRAPSQLPTPVILDLPGCTETPLRFGAAQRLAGMLCRPALDRDTGFALVICNAGGMPRHGFARFGVQCARALAQAGFASLRFDFAGLGDSIYYSDGVDLQTDVFTEDRTADIQDALSALEGLGFRRFGIQGLCSGAYHALHGACADARISQLHLINLPWFSLQHERPGPDSVTQRCMNGLFSREAACLFLFGENDAGLKLFEQHFGVGGYLLPASANIRLCVLPGLDHELTAGWMRREVVAKIIDFVRNHQAKTCAPRAEGEIRHDHA